MLLWMNEPDGIFRTNPFHCTIKKADMFRILGEKPQKDRVNKFEHSNFGMGVLGYILGKQPRSGLVHL